MARKKKAKKQEKQSYGERILKLVGKSWTPTGKIIKGVGCPARAARRVLRGLVKSRQLKSVKVQRERYFAAPGTKVAPPKAEGNAKGNGRTRTRSRKAATKAGGKKASAKRRRAPTPAPAPKSAKKRSSKQSAGSGNGTTPVSAPDSIAEVQAAATQTVAQSGAAEQGAPRSVTDLLG